METYGLIIKELIFLIPLFNRPKIGASLGTTLILVTSYLWGDRMVSEEVTVMVTKMVT